MPPTLSILTIGPLMQLFAAAETWTGLTAGAAALAGSCLEQQTLEAEIDSEHVFLRWPGGRCGLKLLSIQAGTLGGLDGEPEGPFLCLQASDSQQNLRTYTIRWHSAADLHNIALQLNVRFQQAWEAAAARVEASPPPRRGVPYTYQGLGWGRADDWFQ